MIKSAYYKGFAVKCAEFGIDPEKLIKFAQGGYITPGAGVVRAGEYRSGDRTPVAGMRTMDYRPSRDPKFNPVQMPRRIDDKTYFPNPKQQITRIDRPHWNRVGSQGLPERYQRSLNGATSWEHDKNNERARYYQDRLASLRMN